jgi:hypothetical protein
MIHDLDSTLERILYERGHLSRTEIEISFDLPNGDWSARLSRPTLNCWAYDIRENLKLRNAAMRVTQQNGIATRHLNYRRYDLSYLITAWARKIEDQHQLLWRALSALSQIPILPISMCDGALRSQPHDIPVVLANMQDSPVNIVDLWSVLENQMRLGFIFVATLALDPEYSYDIPLVLEQQVSVGQSSAPAEGKLDVKDIEIRRVANKDDSK